MKKIPTMFLRVAHRLTGFENPDCAWVFRGEGIATEKLDGTNVRLTVRAGEVVRVEKRRNPTKAQKARGIIDPWYVDADDLHADQWIMAASVGTDVSAWPDGEHCCEAIGAKIQGNPLGLEGHTCIPFDLLGLTKLVRGGTVPRTFFGLRDYFGHAISAYGLCPVEGIVFHHPDGRRAKIKRKDFE